MNLDSITSDCCLFKHKKNLIGEGAQLKDFSFRLESLLPGISLGMLNRIEEFLFHFSKSRPRDGARGR